MSSEHKTQSGFTLIELLITFIILAVASMAFGLTELSAQQRQQDLKARDIAFARAQAIMERVLRMPFGTPGAAKLTSAQYDALFGTDQDVRTMGLTQIQQHDTDGDGLVDEQPIQFKLEGVEDAGSWAVHVDADLDGNGVIEPTIDGVETREGRTDLLRIEILRNGRTVLRAIRARTPQEQGESESILK